MTFNPAAGAYEFFCLGKKFLVFNMLSRNLKVKYRRSFFGFLWTLFQPMGLVCVYYFVFNAVLKIHVPHYLAFILSGILPWTFFSQSLAEGTESILGNGGLVSKIPIPIQVFPLVGNLTNWINLLLAFPVLVLAVWLSGAPLSPVILFTPLLWGVLLLMSYSLSLILAISLVFLRDLRHIVGILLQIWFYATPVIYGAEMVPDRFRFVLYLNPVGSLFSMFHSLAWKGELPPLNLLGVTFAWAGGLLLLAVVLTQLLGQKVPEKI